eukprot:EG_transcript_25377
MTDVVPRAPVPYASQPPFARVAWGLRCNCRSQLSFRVCCIYKLHCCFLSLASTLYQPPRYNNCICRENRLSTLCCFLSAIFPLHPQAVWLALVKIVPSYPAIPLIPESHIVNGLANKFPSPSENAGA